MIEYVSSSKTSLDNKNMISYGGDVSNFFSENNIAIILIAIILFFIGMVFIHYYLNKPKEQKKIINPEYLNEIENEWGFYKNSANGGCLSIIGPGKPNASIVISECTGRDDQLWKLLNKLDVIQPVVTASNSNPIKDSKSELLKTYPISKKSFVHYPDQLCIDPDGVSALKGAYLTLFSCDSGAEPLSQGLSDEVWNIEPVDNSSNIKFVNNLSKMCLDVDESSAGSTTPLEDSYISSGDTHNDNNQHTAVSLTIKPIRVTLNDCKKIPNQEWRFIPTPKKISLKEIK
jgi:hypothetical protein